MNEDLKDISLIDQFLMNELTPSELTKFELRCETDPEFKKQLEKYQMIYQEIDRIETERLKKKFLGYHQAYQESEVLPKRKNKRILWIASGIAAVLCIGWLLVVNQQNTSEFPQFPTQDPQTVEVDTLRFKDDSLSKSQWANKRIDSVLKRNDETIVVGKEPVENPVKKDTGRIRINPTDDVQLALGGLKTLPYTQVRKIDFPRTPKYQFNGTTLKLYVDPSLGSLGWEIYKKDSSYLVAYGDVTYALEKSNRIQPLRKVQEMNPFTNGLMKAPLKGTPTEEIVKVQFNQQDGLGVATKRLIVQYKESTGETPRYFFKTMDTVLHLFLTMEMHPETTEVFIVQDKNRRYYYLKTENRYYTLDVNANEERNARMVNILADRTARLFMDKAPIEIRVFQLKK